MKRIEYTTVDKSAWSRGEWDNEPDKIQWPDPITGLPCLIVRGPAGALCGYVGVSPGHKLYGFAYNECPQSCGDDYCEHRPEGFLSVHGGITYSDFCAPHGDDHARGICHMAAPGEPDKVWWLGFDCAHAFDICPHNNYGFAREAPRSAYRNIAYVADQCGALAAQLSNIR